MIPATNQKVEATYEKFLLFQIFTVKLSANDFNKRNFFTHFYKKQELQHESIASKLGDHDSPFGDGDVLTGLGIPAFAFRSCGGFELAETSERYCIGAVLSEVC